MFICQVCEKNQNTAQKTIVLEKRQRVYKNTLLDEDDKPFTKTTSGWEIVKEKKVCQECADNHLLATTPAK